LPANSKRPSGADRSHIGKITREWKTERPDLDLSDFLFQIYVMRLGRMVDQAYDRMCRARFGISGSDMRVLLALRRSGPPYAKRPTELFRALLVTSGAMSKQVDRLERLKLVERRAESEDGRRPQIRLTRRGLSVVDAAVNAIARRAVVSPAMKRFTQRERKAVSQFCLQILEHLERDKPGR
jgi:DNA-binding MarR family transcriptional regulator